MAFEPSEDTRTQILENVISTCEKRFYDPQFHGTDFRSLFNNGTKARLRKTARFTADLNKILATLRAYPLEFFHESERRVALAKTIWCSFHAYRSRWIFQDVLPDGLADKAGVVAGATLLAIDGQPLDSSAVPRFQPSTKTTVQFENPGALPVTFTFSSSIKESEQSIRYVTARKITSRIGYIRISKWPGALGIDVAQATDTAIRRLNKPYALIIDLRGNLGSAGAGNLRLMSYLTPDKIPVGYGLTRWRAEAGYRPEELAQFKSIPRFKFLAPFTLLKFRNVDKSIALVTEGLGKQAFHQRTIVLVNEHTISGSEIVAGFASDHKLATLVGTPTAGTLLGWSSLSVGSECWLTLPTVNYRTWEGRSFEGIGVLPDRDVPFSAESAIAGIDNQLQAAIEYAEAL
jgi:carboxyl-terminal processing protease